VVVCQVGEGSDELFWGYPSWRFYLKLQYLNSWPVPGFLKRTGLAGLKAFGKQYSLYYEILRRGTLNLPVFWGGATAFCETEKRQLLSERLRKKLGNFSSWEALEPIRARFLEKAWEKSPLHWMSYLDLNFRLPELLLMRVDKMSMGVSLEGRVPFLDHKLVELALSIPEKIKTKDGVLKYILKKSVRGIIPDELIDRNKQGFGVPVYEWFFDKLGEEADREIQGFCKETDFLDRSWVKRLLEQKRGTEAWFILNLALWHRHYIGD
jgi:asparagine synthase (glutamine-hydrolysing)